MSSSEDLLLPCNGTNLSSIEEILLLRDKYFDIKVCKTILKSHIVTKAKKIVKATKTLKVHFCCNVYNQPVNIKN